MANTIFTKDLTLNDPDYFQNNLANRLKNMLRSYIPNHASAWINLNYLWDKKIAHRSVILHPDIFFWLKKTDLKNINEENINELDKILHGVIKSIEFMHKNQKNLKINIDISNDYMHITDRLKRAEVALDPNKSISLNIISCDINLLKLALAILKEHNLAFFLEIERFITNIVMFQGRTIIGFTDFHNHGAIFIKYDMVKNNPLFLAEEIVHESSHTVLNTVMVTDVLVKNSKKERYKTPLRKDERPMFGLFHQLYVLAKLNYFYESIKDNRHKYRHQQIKEKLAQALATVKTYAQFSELGKQFFLELEGYC